MGKINKIIGVDFDGTLAVTKGTYPIIKKPIPEVIEYVKEQQSLGANIILVTMREEDDLKAAVEWCKNQGIEFDAVNDNLPIIQEFFESNPRKIFVNEYIDDTNMGGLDYILNEIKRRKELD